MHLQLHRSSILYLPDNWGDVHDEHLVVGVHLQKQLNVKCSPITFLYKNINFHICSTWSERTKVGFVTSGSKLKMS